MLPEKFRCYLVTRDDAGGVRGALSERRLAELPPGEVVIRVEYSSLNYKDALAATGHSGVTKVFPHVPGVDAAGVVAESGVYEFVPGDRVLVTGYDMGASRWGGWAEYVRVPQDWIVPLPDGLTGRQSMMLGTAGLTAALCVDALLKHDAKPAGGDVLVTGASGGVGSMAVSILAGLGFRVVAATGKMSAHEYLRRLGAAEIVGREVANDASGKPLLPRRWAGAVDTVGGPTLGAVIRATKHFGCVAACGNAGGHELPLTVYPFILRGVTLAGVDAAQCPMALRHELWKRLADPWKPPRLAEIATVADLDELPPRIGQILAGQMTGRLAVQIDSEADAVST
jgi:putative YhdH/YhfP family quinone oxidoreductase